MEVGLQSRFLHSRNPLTITPKKSTVLSKNQRFDMKIIKSKKPLFFILSVISLYVLSAAQPAWALECQVIHSARNDSSVSNATVESEIKSYLSKNSFPPIFKNNEPSTFRTVGIFNDSSTNVACVLGSLNQGENSLVAFFTIDTGWFYNTTELHYLTVDTDFLPEFQLFKNVYSTIELNLGRDLSNSYLFIQKFEGGPDDIFGQVWSFRNGPNCIRKIVAFKELSDGSTHYVILEPPKDIK